MSYTNAQYCNDHNGNPSGISVEINGAAAFVPIAQGNTDYEAIMTLVAAGQLIIQDAPPPAPPSVPQDVSVWQFMMAAWKMGFITQAEALAAVKYKVMPPAFAAALADMPEENQAEAQLKFAGITRMVRSDPLFALVIGSNIATGAQIDAVFTLADSIA